jgi:hypothetical protein
VAMSWKSLDGYRDWLTDRLTAGAPQPKAP